MIGPMLSRSRREGRGRTARIRAQAHIPMQARPGGDGPASRGATPPPRSSRRSRRRLARSLEDRKADGSNHDYEMLSDTEGEAPPPPPTGRRATRPGHSRKSCRPRFRAPPRRPWSRNRCHPGFPPGINKSHQATVDGSGHGGISGAAPRSSGCGKSADRGRRPSTLHRPRGIAENELPGFDR